MTTWRLPLTLCLSIVFGAPILSRLLQSQGDVLASGIRYAAALGLAWAGVGVITRMVDGFHESNRHRDHEQALAAAKGDGPTGS